MKQARPTGLALDDIHRKWNLPPTKKVSTHTGIIHIIIPLNSLL